MDDEYYYRRIENCEYRNGNQFITQVNIHTVQEYDDVPPYVIYHLSFVLNGTSIMCGKIHGIPVAEIQDDNTFIETTLKTPCISCLKESFLNNWSIVKELRTFIAEEKVSSVYNFEYELYNFEKLGLFVRKYNCMFEIKNKRRLATILSRIIHDSILDITEIGQIGVIYLKEDIVDALNLSESAKNVLMSSDKIVYNNELKDQTQSIPITDAILERKRETGNYFIVTDKIKESAVITLAKFCLMGKRQEIVTLINDNYEILRLGTV